MSANLVRAGAARAAQASRAAAQASRAAAQALAQGTDASLRSSQPRLRWMEDEDALNVSDDLPSLRSRLEADALTALGGRWADPRPSRPAHAPTSRSSASSVAARLVQDVYCALEPGTPRYLASALAAETTPGQCRLVLSAEPPYRVISASADYLCATGMREDEVEGRPALAVLLSGQVAGAPGASARWEGVDGLLESLHMHCRGCAEVACRGAGGRRPFPAKVTVSPLMDHSGEVSAMLCVVRPLGDEAEVEEEA